MAGATEWDGLGCPMNRTAPTLIEPKSTDGKEVIKPLASAYLTPGETARALKVSRSAVLWMADTRRLRAVRTDSGRRLISRRDVERVRQAREQARGTALQKG
jgi:excisionase family DNA binding protein